MAFSNDDRYLIACGGHYPTSVVDVARSEIVLRVAEAENFFVLPDLASTIIFTREGVLRSYRVLQ